MIIRSPGRARIARTFALLACIAAYACAVASPAAAAVPPGFSESTALSGLTNPTVVRFAADGRIIVAEKSGLIKSFSGVGDPSAETVADLRRQVHNFWDRGLLGMALDPNFTANNRIYVLYAHDAPIGGTAPVWGSLADPPPTSDPCPTPPGPTSDGCVISGRLSRLTLNGTPAPPETVLVEDWCQQYPSHSVGSLEFDDSGALYASGGDGASFTFPDYGQDGNPLNPCGDPPVPVGGIQTPPTAEGGALRSQDLRTSADPTSLDGTVIKINPDTGAGWPTNPLAGSANPMARRVIASGLRNPFRFAFSPAGELWVGDVGWGSWEEVNRLASSPPSVTNFGWPCYEGAGRQGSYDAANLNLCESLYAGGPVAAPHYAYDHAAQVVPGESCPTGSSSIAGLEFYEDDLFPASYANGLFFADYSRDCIWFMAVGAGGQPDPAVISSFAPGAANPVFIEIGPDGALYYADFDGGRIQRVVHTAGNQPPNAVAAADPTSGAAPLAVDFDATGSSDPEGHGLSYAWDLDGDGAYDDSTSATPSRTYTEPATVDVGLRVTDIDGGEGFDSVRISVGNDPPLPTITAPQASDRWAVGETIAFAGSASDPQQGSLPASALDWDLIIDHCPSNCHQHGVQSFEGVASGSFAAPDHEYPSDLLLRLTATDAGGLEATTSVVLHPRTVELTLTSAPAGLSLSLNALTQSAPFTTTVIEGSTNTILAPVSQPFEGRTWLWQSWSDGGQATHSIVAESSRTYTATYGSGGAGDPPVGDPDELVIETLKLKLPQRISRLLDRGGRAKLRCNLDCRAQLKLKAKGRDARALDVAGTVAKTVESLDAGEAGWVKARVRKAAAKRLEAAGEGAEPRFVARIKAWPN